jgi:preprotein translocase subunit SecA
MMARIEDEALRYLYFLQPYDENGNILTASPIQVGEDDEEEEEQVESHEPAPVPAAAASITDFTKNIQRKKEKELEALQYVGGDSTASSKPQPVVKGAKVGRNEPCPCGSGKKYKVCHGR